MSETSPTRSQRDARVAIGPDVLGIGDTWAAPLSTAARISEGTALRKRLPRRLLGSLSDADRDPLGIITAQNAARLPELIPLRTQRMAQSPFAFYRGTAALMAADFAAEPHTGLLVPSCGDAHVANFGFYASRQRTLLFDLNDFDESAWAPWEWDLKRLIASVVIGAQAGSRSDAVVRAAVVQAVQAYARALRAGARTSPSRRYYAHFDAEAVSAKMRKGSGDVLRRAIAQAKKRTGERAAKKLTVADADGRLRFIVRPPTMIPLENAAEERVRGLMQRYLATAQADITVLLHHYRISDAIRRVVGVGSVGTRCALTLLQDGDGHALILQSKEAGRSVIEQYGKIAQPSRLRAAIEEFGEGARVVGLQRVLQGASDPFLGFIRYDGLDLYVRQFHDMKGGIEVEEIDDEPFVTYASACAVTLARAHAQSPNAAQVSGYLGSGRRVAEALHAWGYAYADRSRADYHAFIAAHPAAAAQPGTAS